jgi:hypothetical protein
MFLLKLLGILLKPFTSLASTFYKLMNAGEKFLSILGILCAFLAFLKSPRLFWLGLAVVFLGKSLKRHATPENWQKHGRPSVKKGLLSVLDTLL